MKSKTNISVKNNRGLRVTSNMILGQNGTYPSATILDANATQELIGEGIDVSDINDKLETLFGNITDINTALEGVGGDIDALEQSVGSVLLLIVKDPQEIDTAIDKFEEIVDFLDGISETTLNAILAQFAKKTEAVLSTSIRQIVTLTQAQFDALSSYDANTEYNVI